MRQAERVDGFEVLARLRLPALIGRDHQHDDGCWPKSGEHVADEPAVARHVDEGEVFAAGQLHSRETEVDRQAAALFFVPAVGVDGVQRLRKDRLGDVFDASVPSSVTAMTPKPTTYRTIDLPAHTAFVGSTVLNKEGFASKNFTLKKVDLTAFSRIQLSVDCLPANANYAPKNYTLKLDQRVRVSGEFDPSTKAHAVSVFAGKSGYRKLCVTATKAHPRERQAPPPKTG